MNILEVYKGGVEAFAAAPDRYTSTFKPYELNIGLLSYESHSTSKQFFTPWQDSDGVNVKNKDEVNISEYQYQNLPKDEKMQHESGCENQEQNVCRLQERSQLQSHQKGDQLLGQAVQNSHKFSQENGLQISVQNLIPFGEQNGICHPENHNEYSPSQQTNILQTPAAVPGEQNRMFHPGNQNQYPKLQQTNNLQSPAAEPGDHDIEAPFDMLLQMMKPQLDKDKFMQLQTLQIRVEIKEISKDAVQRHMRNIVGDQMFRQTLYNWLMQKEQNRAQAAQNSQAVSHKLHAQSQTPSQKQQQQQQQQVCTQVLSITTALGAGTKIKTPSKKLSIGQKKPLDALGTPSRARKKQKVAGAFLDQVTEQLNDVTAISGVDLMEEEAQLLSEHMGESAASESIRRVVQEEEERLILQSSPFQKKLAKITSDCGIKNVSKDVKRCLSLCLEERMRGLVSDLIRESKLRVDTERSRHRTMITSDIRRQILIMNRKAKEDWEEKQTDEAKKLRKLNETKGITGADGEDKVEGHAKTFKEIKAEREKSNRMAANAAVRAAAGGDDMLSRWQSIADQARQKREGMDSASVIQMAKEVTFKTSIIGRTSRGTKDVENRSPSTTAESGAIRKCGRNAVAMPCKKVLRTITVRDVINVLEREPQMTKSTLVYRLYERMHVDIPASG